MGFGAFKPLCRTVGSYPICNIFFKQLSKQAPSALNVNDSRNLTTFENIAPVGINIECGIPRATDGHLGNIANVILCGLSLLFVLYLASRCSRRVAAVGRVELRALLLLYAITLPLQLLTTGSLLKQSSTSLVILTAIHVGTVVALFWVLLANALVATQIVEDGTPSSLIPFYAVALALFAVTTYISLDTAFGFTSAFKPSNPPSNLTNITLFVLTSVWPAFCVFAYLIIMTYVVLGILQESRPLAYYIGAALLFVLSQLAYFLLSKVICKGTGAKVDGSFLATLLETASIGVLFAAWISITEDSWDNDYYPT